MASRMGSNPGFDRDMLEIQRETEQLRIERLKAERELEIMQLRPLWLLVIAMIIFVAVFAFSMLVPTIKDLLTPDPIILPFNCGVSAWASFWL